MDLSATSSGDGMGDFDVITGTLVDVAIVIGLALMLFTCCCCVFVFIVVYEGSVLVAEYAPILEQVLNKAVVP